MIEAPIIPSVKVGALPIRWEAMLRPVHLKQNVWH